MFCTVYSLGASGYLLSGPRTRKILDFREPVSQTHRRWPAATATLEQVTSRGLAFGVWTSEGRRPCHPLRRTGRRPTSCPQLSPCEAPPVNGRRVEQTNNPVRQWRHRYVVGERVRAAGDGGSRAGEVAADAAAGAADVDPRVGRVDGVENDGWAGDVRLAFIVGRALAALLHAESAKSGLPNRQAARSTDRPSMGRRRCSPAVQERCRSGLLLTHGS